MRSIRARLDKQEHGSFDPNWPNPRLIADIYNSRFFQRFVCNDDCDFFHLIALDVVLELLALLNIGEGVFGAHLLRSIQINASSALSNLLNCFQEDPHNATLFFELNGLEKAEKAFQSRLVALRVFDRESVTAIDEGDVAAMTNLMLLLIGAYNVLLKAVFYATAHSPATAMMDLCPYDAKRATTMGFALHALFACLCRLGPPNEHCMLCFMQNWVRRAISAAAACGCMVIWPTSAVRLFCWQLYLTIHLSYHHIF